MGTLEIDFTQKPAKNPVKTRKNYRNIKNIKKSWIEHSKKKVAVVKKKVAVAKKKVAVVKKELLVLWRSEKNTTKKLFLTSVENNYCCSLPEFDLLIEFTLYHNLGKKKIHNRVCGFEKKIRKLLFNIILNVFLPVFSNFSLVDFLKTYLCLAVKSTILLLMLLYVTITIKLLLQFLQKLHYYYYLRGKIQVNQYFNSKNLSLSKGCTYM